MRCLVSAALMLSVVLMSMGCPDNNQPSDWGGFTNVANAGSPMGTNLNEVAYWSTEWPFLDAMKSSGEWIAGTAHVWEDGSAIDLDENGWVRSLGPGQVVHTLLFRHQAVYPAGKYHVLYEGEGDLRYRFAASKDVAASEPGHDVLDVTPSVDGINIMIFGTNPGNYLRRIRVIMPGYVSASNPFDYVETLPAKAADDYIELWRVESLLGFHPEFLHRLEHFETLRFMDWMATNNSNLSRWEDRARPDDARYSSEAGVPVEVMCDLANWVNADPWFCMPALADDDFLEQFAATVRDNLDPGLRAHIEHANELWLSGFGQSHYALEQGYGLGDTDTERTIRYHSKRSVEIFDIFEGILGLDRLVRVMGSQAANKGISRLAMDYNDAYLKTDALAVAPYFGSYLGTDSHLAETLALSLGELFAELGNNAVPEAVDWMNAHAALAEEYGVELIAYEGGQHLVGVGENREIEALQNLFAAANRDPRMGGLYASYLDSWRAATGGTFCHFTNCGQYTRWGYWGSMEYLTQPVSEAPKYAAIEDFATRVGSLKR